MRVFEPTHARNRHLALGSLLIILIVGAIAGWLAGQIVKGYGFGLVGNTVVGIFGAIIHATIGAVILLFVIRLIKRA
jgi:uncharacterized membrane protein YeaQ/YmgE (transglycosylase-associated protein family)